MRKKYKLDEKVLNVLQKYCNGHFGFESQQSRLGNFQKALVKVIALLLQEYLVFSTFFQGQAFEFLTQVMEESIIFSILDLNQGENCNNHFFFLKTALDVIELGINASL